MKILDGQLKLNRGHCNHFSDEIFDQKSSNATLGIPFFVYLFVFIKCLHLIWKTTSAGSIPTATTPMELMGDQAAVTPLLN